MCPNAVRATQQAPIHTLKVCTDPPCTDHLLAGVQNLASAGRDAVLFSLDRYYHAVSGVTSDSIKLGFD